MQIRFKSVRIFVTIRGKTRQAQLGNCQNGIRTPVKFYVYLRFVL